MRVRLTAKVAPLASRAAGLLRYLVIPSHQVESLLASRDACMLRSSYHAAMLDRRALAKLGKLNPHPHPDPDPSLNPQP